MIVGRVAHGAFDEACDRLNLLFRVAESYSRHVKGLVKRFN
jgi:uncharacterized C2H2 Zn-finger protein